MESSSEYKGEYGIKGRRYCVLYNPDKTIAYVHLHIYQQGASEIEEHLRFRDQLRSSPTARELYSQHKQYLIQELKVSRAAYSDAKTEIINRIGSYDER